MENEIKAEILAYDNTLTEDDVIAMIGDFKELDLDGDGKLSRDELQDLCATYDTTVDGLFSSFDADNDQHLDLKEYLYCMCFLRNVEPQGDKMENKIKAEILAYDNTLTEDEAIAFIADFHEMDLDGDGKLSREELEEFCAANGSTVDDIFTCYDGDNDEHLDLKEYLFYRCFLRTVEPQAENQEE